MAMTLRLLRPLAVALVLLPGIASAQAPAPAPPTGQAPDTIKQILDQELEPAPGGYTYNPQGRRDPFVSLLKPVGPTSQPIRPPGMAGFLIQEVALKGIVKTSGEGMGPAEKPGYIAMFLGTDGKSYFVNVGQRLYDGEIIAVDAANVTFRQEVTDPLSPVRTREIKKSLYQSEEARQ
jgi:type IV pilus assembly protein PilP